MATVRNAAGMSLRLFSVAIGVVVVLALSFVLRYAAFVFIWALHLPNAGPVSTGLALAVTAFSLGAGGYVAACLSRAKDRAAVAVGIGVGVLSVAAAVLRPTGVVWWQYLLNCVFLVAFASAGGRLAQRANRRSLEPDEPEADATPS